MWLSCLVFPCLALPCLVLSCLVLCHLVLSCGCFVLSCLAVSCGCLVVVLSCLFLPCFILPCLVLWLCCVVLCCVVLCCLLLSCLVVSWLNFSCHYEADSACCSCYGTYLYPLSLSCWLRLVLPSHVFSCLVLTCLILCCLVLSLSLTTQTHTKYKPEEDKKCYGVNKTFLANSVRRCLVLSSGDCLSLATTLFRLVLRLFDLCPGLSHLVSSCLFKSKFPFCFPIRIFRPVLSCLCLVFFCC